MSDTEFNEYLTDRLDKTELVLASKSREYSRNNDKLHNFNVGARLENKTREEVIHSFLLKHYISYTDMVKDISEGMLPKEQYVDEKIGDLINYLILMEASIKEKIRINNEKVL